ncbi:helix-turn-helix transcriptional regulator [Clostridium tyrobutyricum]|uniref:helix-turn-helix transcriptional regulator n=1 Tax=Clostridium tyrobutyricum TaxID=1519 RepID=UPI001C393DD7|nr:helix-turn-helix transcriptional regulator [Clostridium tyrobutyricum]MBV4415112.1 helix-turn-helix transcriptional regulator [Clostridium tyrobutyricum]
MSKNNLKILRKQKGLTQIKLSQMLGITNDYLSSIERGKVTPGFKLAKKISDQLGATVDEIFFNNHSNKIFDGGSNKKLEQTKEVV